MSAHTPRPLHLVTNSTGPTPTADEFSSPKPPSSFRHPKRYSMMAAPTMSSSPTTPSTPPAQTKASRRKSSIGYFPPGSTENSRRGSLIRRNSLGTLNESLGAAGSAGHMVSWTRRGDRTSVLSLPASAVPGAESAPESPARDRLPLTLTEKHADLLRFIAQKESKCLELRSQLTMHEAELVELKRKWQRIVNKGLDRGFHSSSVNGSTDTSSVVFDGIKEGVQGMSRLFAAGFSSHAHTVPSSPALSSSSIQHHPTSNTKHKPSPPSLIRKYHSARESESSVSTYTTSRSADTTDRFSQSSMSSFGEESLVNGTGGLEAEAEGKESRTFEGEDNTHGDESDPNAQVLMVRDTGATPTMSPNPEFHQQKRKQQSKSNNRLSMSFSPTRQTTTATSPTTISPAHAQMSLIGDFDGQTRASEVQIPSTTTKAHRRKSRDSVVPRLDFEHLDFSSLSPSVLLSPPYMSMLNGSDSNSTTTSPGASPHLGGRTPPPNYFDPKNSTGLKPKNSSSSLAGTGGTGGLAPMSSIPGLGLAAGPVGSSWMDSMGKTFGQLQRSSTFTKNQKRASLLLADMSNSIVNVLTPPSTTPSVLDTSANGTRPASSKNLKAPPSPNPSSTGSLLDDEDEDETAKLGSKVVLQPVTTRNPSLPASSATLEKIGAKRNSKKEKESGDFDDEEWNW